MSPTRASIRQPPRTATLHLKPFYGLRFFNTNVHIITKELFFRYYNSWIETSNEPVPSDTSSITVTSGSPQKSNLLTDTPSTDTKSLSIKGAVNSLGLFDNVDCFSPGQAEDTVDWSADPVDNNNDESSSSNDDDDDYVFGASFLLSDLFVQ